MSTNGCYAISEVDGANCGIRNSGDGVSEGLSVGFVCASADGVPEAT